jgi:hypothetical protein
MSSVRLRIVINDNNGTVREQPLFGALLKGARTGAWALDQLSRTWDELVVLLRRAWEELIPRLGQGAVSVGRHTRYALCGLRGHDDQLRAERNHLALACGRCGRVTPGWDLTESSRPYASPSRHHAAAAGPRYLELVRRRS